jgi:hypothetical protein
MLKFIFLFYISCEGQITDTSKNVTAIKSIVEPTFLNNEISTPTLRRLNQEQYKNTIREYFEPKYLFEFQASDTSVNEDFIEAELVFSSQLEPDLTTEGLYAIGSSVTSISPIGVERYEQSAFNLAEQIVQFLQESDVYHDLFFDCLPTNLDLDCAQIELAKHARHLWRRDLVESEKENLHAFLTEIHASSGDIYTTIEYGLAILFQSPHFLYRKEVGNDNGDLSAFELASKLSFLLWNSSPDTELLDVASSGDILDKQILLEQSQRMMEDPRFQQGLRSIFKDFFALQGLQNLTKDPFVFTHANPDLGYSAEEETLRLLEYIILDQDDDFRTFLTSETTFVDRRLAALYNIPAPSPTDFAMTQLDPINGRRGFLGQASFLALQSHATSTSATLRGLFVRSRLLCQSIPAPPADVDTSIPEADASSPTLRERIQSHLSNDSCAVCHQLTDLIGLGFENFDGIGRWRNQENGVTIDSSGELDGAVFGDAWELAQRVSDNQNFSKCMTKQLIQYTSGHVLQDAEKDHLDWLHNQFAYEQYSFQSLILEMIASEWFQKTGTNTNSNEE